MRCIVATLLLAAASATCVASDNARIDYLLYCRGCHLADGTSLPPIVPTLVDEIGRIVALPGGREYIVRVPGVAHSDLSDARLAAVLNWVMTELNATTMPASFEPYTAEYVGATRKLVLKDPLRHRAQLVKTAE